MDLRDDRDVSITGEESAELAGEPSARAEPIVHRLATPAPEAAEALAAILRNHGYEVDVQGTAVAATRYEAADDEERRVEAIELLRELAAEHGGSYEGSETSP